TPSRPEAQKENLPARCAQGRQFPVDSQQGGDWHHHSRSQFNELRAIRLQHRGRAELRERWPSS
ncbi:hypothetical protein, partial [Methylocystis echinoides]|uniref:hypothetical protein n=1 Tax=Methylocystis echinoides TaxID=29468 RepID=UPI0024928FB5